MNLLDTGIVIDINGKNNYSSAIISPITLLEVLRGVEDKKRPHSKAVYWKKASRF